MKNPEKPIIDLRELRPGEFSDTTTTVYSFQQAKPKKELVNTPQKKATGQPDV